MAVVARLGVVGLLVLYWRRMRLSRLAVSYALGARTHIGARLGISYSVCAAVWVARGKVLLAAGREVRAGLGRLVRVAWRILVLATLCRGLALAHIPP